MGGVRVVRVYLTIIFGGNGRLRQFQAESSHKPANHAVNRAVQISHNVTLQIPAIQVRFSEIKQTITRAAVYSIETFFREPFGLQELMIQLQYYGPVIS